MAMQQINKPEKKQKVNPLDVAFKALNAAGGVVKTGATLAELLKKPGVK